MLQLQTHALQLRNVAVVALLQLQLLQHLQMKLKLQ